jgi:hypothetical protein
MASLDVLSHDCNNHHVPLANAVAGGSYATINARARKPGRYEFIDEYNEKTAPVVKQETS